MEWRRGAASGDERGGCEKTRIPATLGAVGQIEVAEAVEFECPFCQRTVFASEKPAALIHTHPMCSQFETMKPEEYVAEVSRRQVS